MGIVSIYKIFNYDILAIYPLFIEGSRNKEPFLLTLLALQIHHGYGSRWFKCEL